MEYFTFNFCSYYIAGVDVGSNVEIILIISISCITLLTGSRGWGGGGRGEGRRGEGGEGEGGEGEGGEGEGGEGGEQSYNFASSTYYLEKFPFSTMV